MPFWLLFQGRDIVFFQWYPNAKDVATFEFTGGFIFIAYGITTVVSNTKAITGKCEFTWLCSHRSCSNDFIIYIEFHCSNLFTVFPSFHV